MDNAEIHSRIVEIGYGNGVLRAALSTRNND